MRYLATLLLGLLVGAVTTAMAFNALSKGREFPQGVMAIMTHHMAQIRRQAEAGRCGTGDVDAHIATLRQVAADIEPAFLPTGSDDARFGEHAEALRARIAELATSSGSCEALLESRLLVGESCKGCHREFKG